MLLELKRANRAKNLKFYKRLGTVKYSFRVWIFFR